MQGELFDKVNSEESTWHLDSGKQRELEAPWSHLLAARWPVFEILSNLSLVLGPKEDACTQLWVHVPDLVKAQLGAGTSLAAVALLQSLEELPEDWMSVGYPVFFAFLLIYMRDRNGVIAGDWKEAFAALGLVVSALKLVCR
eukprot:g9106.t1